MGEGHARHDHHPNTSCGRMGWLTVVLLALSKEKDGGGRLVVAHLVEITRQDVVVEHRDRAITVEVGSLKEARLARSGVERR